MTGLTKDRSGPSGIYWKLSGLPQRISPTVASGEGESAEGVAHVGQGLAVAGVVELVGEQYCPPPLLRADPHAGASEAVVDPDVVIAVGARGRGARTSRARFEGAGLDGQ